MRKDIRRQEIARAVRCTNFESLEGRLLFFSVPIHAEMTGEALPFLNAQTVAAIAVEHGIVDTIGGFDSDNHFDNCHFTGGVENINEQLSEAVADANPTDLDPVLAAGNFGHALHGAEDLYAHSNWVNLGQASLFDDGTGYWTPVTPYEVRDGVMVVQGPSPFGAGSVTREGLTVFVNTGSQVFKGVISGQFGFEPADCPPEAVVHHDELNKDSSDRPLYQQAHDLAIQQVRHEFFRLVQLVQARYGTAQPLLDAWVNQDATSQQQLQDLLAERSPSLGSVDSAGVLTLNVGPRAGLRAAYVDRTDSAEAFAITHVSGLPSDPGGEVVDVTWNGLTQRFTVTAIAANAGLGDDSLTLTGVRSSVNFAGGAGTDALTINTAAGSTGANYVVGPTSVNAAGALTDYAGIETLTLRAAGGDDAINVQGTAPGVAVTIHGAEGNDQFTIDSNGSAAGGTVDLVRSALVLNGGAGSNTLTLEDSSDTTADVVTITPAAVGAATGNTFFGAGGKLNYTGMAAMSVSMPNSTRGDTVRLTPSASTRFTINGNGPNGPASAGGDLLFIATSGTTGLKSKVTAKDAGVWTFTNRLPVTYLSMEKVKRG